MQPLIVGIRFQEIGKVYHFDAASISDIQIGDRVIVDTARGRQLGEVIQLVKNPDLSSLTKGSLLIALQ